ncbi:MAG TPA: hypothetical protein DEH78_23660 [Solibacterales bacterium]|nr:hypothetical protein [Bryobacterales bacterium]
MTVLHWLPALFLLAPPPAGDDHGAQLLQVRRVYVEKFTGGDSAAQVRDMIISSLAATRLFIITENEEKADAVLRGSAEDLVFTDTFQSSEGLSANVGGGRSRSGSRGAGFGSAGVSDHESVRITERKHEATAAVRLLNREGDVIWSATEESLGGKFRSASADVAAKVAKRLSDSYEKARRERWSAR